MGWFVASLVVLALAGLVVGGQINRAIYGWAWFERRLYSPWGPLHADASPRRWTDRIPVTGWIALRRDAELHGKGYWIRPLLIELGCGIFFPAFFAWQMNDGLLLTLAAPFSDKLHWYIAHLVLCCLMLIATFIDFDEKTIPDQVTVPGTLMALGFAAIWPNVALPIEEPTATGAVGAPLRFYFPSLEPGEWSTSSAAMWASIGIIWVWCLALIPKTIDLRKGPAAAVRFAWASIIRPPRKKAAKKKFKAKPRRMMLLTKLLLLLGVMGSVGLILFFRFAPNAYWISLLSAVLGMGFGGLLTWSIRIGGTLALRKEAMGFGDVTLMAMIGAYLGWQSSLLVFLFAPFSALFVATTQWILTRQPRIAFGPYLCVSAVILIFGWAQIWNTWAGPLIFSLGSMFLAIVAVCIVLSFGMLALMRLFTGRE